DLSPSRQTALSYASTGVCQTFRSTTICPGGGCEPSGGRLQGHFPALHGLASAMSLASTLYRPLSRPLWEDGRFLTCPWLGGWRTWLRRRQRGALDKPVNVQIIRLRHSTGFPWVL